MKKALILFVCILLGANAYAQTANQAKDTQSRVMKLYASKSIDSVYQSLLKANPAPIVVVDGKVASLAALKPWDVSKVSYVEILNQELAGRIYGNARAEGAVRFMFKPVGNMPATWSEAPRQEWKAEDNTVYDSSTPDIFMASYPKGLAALHQFLKENTVYPEAAKKNKIEGEVLLSFIVEKDGKVTNVKIDKGLGHGLDEEANRIISLRRWNPAILKGHPVRVSYKVPVEFKLN